MRCLPAVALAAAPLLFACGGGGGGSPTAGVMEPDPPAPDGIATRTTQDGQSAARVVDYLLSQDKFYPGIIRFENPPTLCIAQGTSDRYRALIHYGTALVNRALPHALHVRIGPDAPPLAAIGDVPDGEIFVDVAFWEDWNDPLKPPKDASIAVAQPANIDEYDPVQQRTEHKRRRAAHTWMRLDRFDREPDHLVISVFVHELLHNLGLEHVPAKFRESLLHNAWFRVDGSLPAIDEAALLALYTRLDPQTEPEDLSIDSLGVWEREVTDIGSSTGPVAYGVRRYNDVDMPWTRGTEPTRALADNRALRGTATWNGALLGRTIAEETVQGDAEISVNLATMNGRADFTGLEIENGFPWNTGSLGYTITVGANHFRSTGGDAGTVNGQFYGANHQGVGGSVERADLTAAFGATRQ